MMSELQRELLKYQALVLEKLEKLARPRLEGVESVDYELKADPDGDSPMRFAYGAPGVVVCEYLDWSQFPRKWSGSPAEAIKTFLPNLDWYETAEALAKAELSEIQVEVPARALPVGFLSLIHI